MSYNTLLTALGAAEMINAQATGTLVPFTHLALGDGNGAAITPVESMTALTHEVHRVAITSVTPDAENPNWLVVEAVVPTTVGGWTIREVGLIGGSGAGNKLLAIGNFPDTYKPLLAQGSARDMLLRMIIQLGNASVVQLTIDPNVTMVTAQSLINAINAHEQKPDPHSQYLTQPEGDLRYRQKSEVIEATDMWLTADATPQLPAEGGLRIYSMLGLTKITLDSRTATPNKLVMAIAQIGGTPTVESVDGVQVNFPLTLNQAPLNYCRLVNNAIPQGIWAGASYGRRTYLGYVAADSGKGAACGAIVMGNTSVLLTMVSDGMLMQAYSADTKTLGTALKVSQIQDEANARPQLIVGLFQLDATRFLFVGSIHSVVVTLTGLTITIGTIATVGVVGAEYYRAAGLLSGSTFLITGSVSNAVKARTISVSGSTITVNAAVQASYITGSDQQRLVIFSPTSAMLGVDQGVWALSVSGATVTMGATVTALAGCNNQVLCGGITANTALVWGYDSAAPTSYKLAVATVTGTAVALGTAVSVAENTSALSVPPPSVPYPENYHAANRLIRLTPTSFALAQAKLRHVSVSGTTVTVSDAVNPTASASNITKLPDGTLLLSDNSSTPGVKTFTATGGVIALGPVLFPTPTPKLSGHSLSDFAEKKLLSNVYYDYPLVGGSSSTTINTIFSLPGPASVLLGDGNSFIFRDKY
ncbi:phage tail protein [Iodobacter sp. BJB302]|uniref:phage tail protein n=1 Tax=Iodobacter sp. BJB302 TaxID=1506510 RepID=UPI000C0FBFFA|nr:phage tail protein [Iodobacter sp. BJB302]PHV00154.1 hypothetical protein CSQ88_18690 [Iodobacter sp. BJB302]